MSLAPKDHTPLEETNFRGLFARGNNDTVPDGYFSDSRNVKYNKDTVTVRDGLDIPAHSAPNIVRAYEYNKIGETSRYVYLDSAGQLFDSLFPSTPIYTDIDFLDFSMAVIFNRAYITPHNRQEGRPGKSVLVYTGSGAARIACGAPPSSFTLTAATSATSGSVELGFHLIAVAYITDTGFITAPGIGTGIAEVEVTVEGRKLDIGSIALGPSYVTKRVLLATKQIPASLYTGNKLGYEFFFVPSGTIENNVDTTATIDFFDIDLAESADYLFDNLATIPAGVAIFPYNQRLVVVNEDGNNWTARVSEQLEPETFNALDGFVTVDPSDSRSGLRNGFEFRKSLILTTSDRIYATSDNDQAASTWGVDRIDSGLGAECFGIATILDARGSSNDRAWIATRAGLVSFEGYVKKPELSSNIEDIWKRINKNKFDLVQVVDDSVYHRMLISIPLDNSTTISHVLCGDYRDAFTVYNTIDERQIKWDLWSFPTNPVSIFGSKDILTGKPVIGVTFSTSINLMKEGLTDDFGNAIDHYAKFNYKTSKSGWINHFGYLQYRIKGIGTLLTTLFGEDDVKSMNAPDLDLTSTLGGEPSKPINFVNEKCAVKVRCNGFGHYFILNKLTIWAKPLWETRP